MTNVPQFGEPEPGRAYADRPAVFGILERRGEIALVQVKKPGHAAWCDLPGGAIDPGETPAQALVREFGEEAGLKVRAGEPFGRADQYFINTDDQAFDNRASFWSIEAAVEAADLKIEEDHTLVWMTPLNAIAQLRHDAHAWAVAAWLRRKA